MSDYPDMMFASVMTDSDELVYDLMPTPDPEPGEVVIKVHVSAVNFEDVLYRHGRYDIQKALPHILGMDAVGEIVVVADDVEGWAVGDRVIASYDLAGVDRDGCYAEYVAMPADYLGRIPDDMDYRTAAKVNYSLCRAWSGLTYNAKLRKRETIVINGASTTIGLSALAVAKWKEATVIAIDSPEKARQLRDAGVSMVLDKNSDDLLTLILTITDDAGVSLAVDMMGETTINESIDLLAFDGRVLSLATYGGDFALVNLQNLMSINGSIVTASDKLKKGDMEKLLAMVAEGSLSPVVDSILPLGKAEEAHQRILLEQASGTILLVPDSLY